MPGYPIDADKLLAAAALLVPEAASSGRPTYTAHRRGVSTAYYAVFHAINKRVALQVFPTADDAFQVRVRRWINHADIRNVSTWIAQIQGTTTGQPPRHIRNLLADVGNKDSSVDASTATIAEGFLELHEKREQADYDHDAVFTRPDALGLIALARDVVTTVEAAPTDQAQVFFGLIGMQARVQSR